MNPSPAAPPKPTILIVDDLPDNLRVLSTTLTEAGYQVRCARNGSMALKAAETLSPALILLDINMPEMDGYEVCQRLKADERTGEIPVIFLSALDEELDKVKAFSVGGIDYITKPFQIGEVLARIHNQLSLQSAKAEILQLNAILEAKVKQRTQELQITNHKLRESEKQLKSILGSLQEVVWCLSPHDLRVLYVNPMVEKVYGRAIADFGKQPNLRLESIHPEDRQRVESCYEILKQKGYFNGEYRIVRPDGMVRWVSDRAKVIYDDKGEAVRLDSIVDDITVRKEAEAQLRHDALHDALTGLPNRALFMEQVELALKQIKRRPNYLFGLLFIDLDRFKLVNDSLGHGVGDRLLIEIARLLEQCVRPTDIVARLGGDEFTILLDNIQELSNVQKIAERILEKLTSPFTIAEHTVFSGASIGIVLGSSDYQSADDLMRNADIAMYRAKLNGKGTYLIFGQEMYTETLKRLEIENNLRLAIERREFFLHYQPIFSVKATQLSGFEALVRWHQPQQGLISPAEFIPVAEETGGIVPIGEWVLEEACRQLQQWRSKYDRASALTMSVNLAGKQIHDPKLLQIIDRILRTTGLPGSCLRLELTESMLMQKTQSTIDLLMQIRHRGIGLSIDDFGQGYSSLSYLPRFPVNFLKVDRAFIDRMTGDSDNLEIVRTIVGLAHTLEMDVIAEGVETAEQLAYLERLNCKFAQGYFLAKPLDARSAEAFLVKSLMADSNPLSQLS